jgi:hypothetical protein
MSETNCQGSLRYIDKEVCLYEDEQIIAQPLPSFQDERDRWEEGLAIGRCC